MATATLHITEDANALLLSILTLGPAEVARLTPEASAAADLCLKAKLVTLVEDGERIRLTPAGRLWATMRSTIIGGI